MKNISYLQLTIDSVIDKKKLSFLEKMANVQTLHLHIKNNQSFSNIIKILSFAFRKLTELVINISLPDEISLEKVHDFMKVIRNNSRLEILAIKYETTVDNYMNIADYFLSELGRSILLLPHLIKLELSLVPYNYDIDVYEEFCNNLSLLKNLQDIYIGGLDSMDIEQSVLRANTMLDAVTHMSKLTGLNMESLYFTHPHISQMLERISQMRDLVHLDLGLRCVVNEGNINFALFGESLSQLTKLRSLDLTLTDFPLADHLGELGASLANLQQLKILTLFFSNSDIFGPPEMYGFCEQISKLTNLTSFVCKFSALHLHPISGLKHSIFQLAKLKNLRKFEFGQSWKLYDRPQNDDACLFIERSPELSQRKQMTLHFNEYDLMTYWVLEGIEASGGCPELEEITIDAKGASDIENSELMTITNFLLKCPKLTSLRYRIKGTPSVGAEESDIFIQNLHKIALQELELSCEDYYFSDDSMMVFCDSLSEIRTLRSIKLEFSGAETLTPVGLICLYECLSRLEVLKEINIYQGNFKFSKLVWREITGHLKKLKVLDKLVLRFSGCCGVSDFGLEYFADALEQLKNLNELRLIIGSCFEVTDTGIARLIKSLQLLQLLEDLELEFQYATRLSQEDRANLESLLNNIHTIENKSIKFTNP